MTLPQILAATVGCIGLATAATMMLPRHVTVARSALIDRPAADILTIAASNSGYQSFNPYLTADPALSIELYGPDAGIGSAFRFEGRDGTGTQTVAEISDTMVRYDIDLGAMGQPVQTISATPQEEGTYVVWTMQADLGFNPVARVIGLFMDGMVGATFETGLKNLATPA